MADLQTIPMFPLAILPLPGELVPLHIFEPRYRQLLQDAEQHDIGFGIYFNHEVNTERCWFVDEAGEYSETLPGRRVGYRGTV
ncbi:MAG: hypothetical protein N2044_08015 [Cyclobacteriaceae bacterium]|nr:hypothetical protein [Cyclobacteriaceae bacterium]